jgi:polysaccharide export outer membrane protein
MRKKEATMTMGKKIRGLVLGLAAISVGLWTAGPALAGGRLLTKEDVITIKVVSQPDMDTTTRVGQDGTVEFPYVGRIKAAGRTEDQLARAIEERLASRQIVTDPHVLIETTGFGTQASIQGQVGSPGAYTLDRDTTLSQFLARAGGLRETAGELTIQRNGRVVARYSSKDIASGKVNANAILVRNNDEIYVDLAPFYYVYGFVGHSGEFELLRPLTVQQAIAIAGGVSALGSEWRMYIKRKSADGQTIEVPASLDDQVQPNDTIVVNERIF